MARRFARLSYMTDEQNRVYAQRYASLLKRYTSSEDPVPVLEAAAALSQDFLADGIAPLEIQRIHDAAIAEGVDPDDAPALVAAHRLLLEVLFAYGAAYSSLTDRLLADADSAEQAVTEGAERAEQNRLALLAGVSHELGNPLMIVKVMSLQSASFWRSATVGRMISTNGRPTSSSRSTA